MRDPHRGPEDHGVALDCSAEVGALATQSFVEVSYGPLGLELMRAGKSAQQALDALLWIAME